MWNRCTVTIIKIMLITTYFLFKTFIGRILSGAVCVIYSEFVYSVFAHGEFIYGVTPSGG